MQKTKPTRKSEIKREWYLYDADGKVLGRFCSEVAAVLRGKNKPYFVSYLDCGDYVVVVNAAKIEVSGNKKEAKIYTRYSGYPGGLRREKLVDLLKRKPEEVIRRAVAGMLPDNKLKDSWLSRLYIYAGVDHPFKDRVKEEKE